jgi:hypothetical protein
MDKKYTLRMSILDENGEEKVIATATSDVISQTSILHEIDAVSLLYRQLLEEYKKQK